MDLQSAIANNQLGSAEEMEEIMRQLDLASHNNRVLRETIERLESSSSLPSSTLVEERTPTGNPIVEPHYEIVQAMERRWHELYDGQTIDEVRDRIYQRLIAASETNSLDSSVHPHPPGPSGRPGLASLIE